MSALFPSTGFDLGLALPLASVVAATIAITVWASRRAKSSSGFYTAEGQLSGWQNGLAIAGDSLSAGAFLGLTALVYAQGFDGLVYAVGYAAGFPIVVFLLAERLRAMGRYTFADALCNRLSPVPARILAALSSLTIIMIYLTAQMVGAGQLMHLLFGLPYAYGLLAIGALMVFYVLVGGMVATTWVQILKAVLMLALGTTLSILILASFGFSYAKLLSAASDAYPLGAQFLEPRMAPRSPVSALSLSVALLFGTSGLPHILMRFFTVPDARTARSSVLWATWAINYFYALIFVIGIGGVALVSRNHDFLDAKGHLIGGANMVAMHLSAAEGGHALFGTMAAVASATILAVVSGLTLAGASAISHDLYACVLAKSPDDRAELRASRVSVLVVGICAIGSGLLFENQNIAYLVGLAFGIAASSTFPLLMLTIYWGPLTTLGAAAGGATGLCSSLILTLLGPAVWMKTLGHPAPIFPIDPPTIVTLPLAVFVAVALSLLDRRLRHHGEEDRRLKDVEQVAYN